MNPSIYWITGLPAAGKTTLALALAEGLERAGCRVGVLDGDELRKGLCSDLGLSAADRTENIRRAGEVARLMVHNGLTVVCAFVSPFQADRQKVRALFAVGKFHEIYLSTSVQECARRDPKGLYALAKAGRVTGLTGWDSVYEAPDARELQYDTKTMATESIVREVLEARRGVE